MAMSDTHPYLLPSALVGDTLLAWMVSGALVVAVLAVSSFRIVPADERLVRFRLGRRGHQLKGPGLVVVLPGIDRGVRVPLRETWADVMWQQATTRDGMSVTVNGAALVSVLDPGRYALASDSPEAAITEALEVEISRYVAERDLVELAESAVDQHGELASEISAMAGEWGVEVARVELTTIEVRLDGDLIRWAERYSARTSPAPQAVRVIYRSMESRSGQPSSLAPSTAAWTVKRCAGSVGSYPVRDLTRSRR
jgi:SPFH domain / Band 7 family